MILLYVVLGLVALAIDRRALLVSALAYVLYALNSLFETYGAVELNVALTALVIGSALLLLSAFWTSARRAVVQPLPDGLQAKLPVLDRAAAVADPGLNQALTQLCPSPATGRGFLWESALDHLQQPPLDRRQHRPELVAAPQHLAGLADQRPHALPAAQRRAASRSDIRAARRRGGRRRSSPRPGAKWIA